MSTAEKHLANGNGSLQPASGQPEEEENIFMFIPNQIGKLVAHPTRKKPRADIRLPRCRLLPHRPRRRLPILHAATSAYLFASLQRILSARRARWLGRAQIQPIYKVWRRAGHGDGSVHDGLSAGFPGFRVPALVARLPRPDQSGSGQPLHAHVRDAEHGRFRPEPQEGRREQELDLEAILLE